MNQVEDLTDRELASLGMMFLGEVDAERRKSLIARVKDPFGHATGPKRILYIGGPSHGWLVTGRRAEGMLGMFASGGAPAVGQRIHDAPRYLLELMHADFDDDKLRELGFRLEQAVYQLESLGDPIIVRFLGWYSDLHDEHGDHIEPAATD